MESKIMWNNQTVGVTAPGLSHGGLGTAFLGSATIKTALETLSPCYSTFRRGTHCPLVSDTIGPSRTGRGTEDCPVCWRKRVVENQRQDRLCPSQLGLPEQSTTDWGLKPQTFIVSLLWRLEVQARGVDSVGSFRGP